MAVLALSYRSDELKKNVMIQVVVPDCNKKFNTPLSEYKIVYLLHGLSEDGSSWIRKSNAERYALERNLVLVMPSADRSMYSDNVLGQNYFTYITKELPQYLHLVLGLSMEKEKNYIMGFSMGGYGAARAALTYPEQYQAWGSLSGVLDLAPLLMMADDNMKREFPFLIQYAGEIEQTPMNPVNLLDHKKHSELCGYIACGLDDDLLICTQRFQMVSEQAGIKNRFVYQEKARHDWNFWEMQLPLFLDFVVHENISNSVY